MSERKSDVLCIHGTYARGFDRDVKPARHPNMNSITFNTELCEQAWENDNLKDIHETYVPVRVYDSSNEAAWPRVQSSSTGGGLAV